MDPVQAGNSLQTWTANNGLAVVLLFGVLILGALASWKGTNWFSTNIAIPLRDAAISHLQTTDKALLGLNDTLREMLPLLKEIRESQVKIQDSQTQILKTYEDLRVQGCNSR